jgi:hypothetical protein
MPGAYASFLPQQIRDATERAALRWLQRFIDERLPPLTEVALAAAALAELRTERGPSASSR